MLKDIFSAPASACEGFRFNGPCSSSPDFLTVLKGKVIFSANEMTYGAELWESDGTGAGTMLLKDIVPAPPRTSCPSTTSPTLPASAERR